MKLIVRSVRRHPFLFLTAIFFLSLEAMADLLQPTLMAEIVDRGVKAADLALILRYGGLMLGIAIGGAIAAVLRNYFATYTSQLIGKELRSQIYTKVQSLSQENIDQLQPASIITRLTNDVTQIQDLINGSMRIMIKAPLTCIGAIILIILKTPRQMPIIFIILLIASLLIFNNMRVGYPRFGRILQKLDRLNTVSREFLSSIRVVKAFNAEKEEAEKFHRASADLSAATSSALQMVATFGPLIQLTVNFGIVVLLWKSRFENTAQIGQVMASVNYMTIVLFALSMVSNILNSMVRATVSATRVDEVLSAEDSQIFAKDPQKPDFSRNLVFDKVSFAYRGAAASALAEISFSLKAGERLGIIGPTGSGKSTLVNLIPRLYDVEQGSIRLHDRDLRDLNIEDLRAGVAIVPQKSLLFSGTIRDNLRFGKRDATEAELLEASRIARIDDFIAESPNGLDSRIGQSGVNLSGGQKQRLSLARALVRQSQILILDDCTSALDAVTEAEILQNISERPQQQSILLISQRVSTVRRCDRILCLENGRVQGLGTHAELMLSCPAYQAIYASQIGGRSHA